MDEKLARSIRGVIAALLLGATSCQDVPERSAIAPVKVEIPGAGATCWQSGNYYIAGATSLEGFATAKGRGVRTVINLTTPDEQNGFDEKAVVEGLGLGYVSIPVTSRVLDDAKLDELLDSMKRAKKPVLIHCTNGDRASALWAAHLGASYGIAPGEAIELAERSGLASDELKRIVTAYLEHRREALAGAPSPGKQTTQ